MVWNKALPGDAEKIRRLGEVIRPNWDAIEEGDDVGVDGMLQMRSVQLSERSATALNDDPTPNVGTHYIYSKIIDGAQECFMRASDGTVIQVTSKGSIGSSGGTVSFNGFTNDGGTTTYDERNFVAYWATVNAAGAIQAQSGGLTCAQVDDVSTYDISFTVNQLHTNYGVNITALKDISGSPRIGLYYTVAVGSFRVSIVNQNGTTSAGNPFTVAVYGGRPT